MKEDQTPEVWDNGTAPHASLAEALAAFQAELPKIGKDETAKVTGENKATGQKVSYSYGYAGLDTVVETVLPVLGKHGLSITSKTAMMDSQFTLLVTLKHESGESEVGEWPLPDPRRSGPQDIGSAMTYGRRYLTLALTGTFPGSEDDDGAKAQQHSRDSWENARPAALRATTDATQGEPKPPKTSWTDEEVREQMDKFKTLAPENAAKLYDWMAVRDLHSRPASVTGLTASTMLAIRLSDLALKEDATVGQIEELRTIAADRGLLNVKVSATETLDEALFTADELAAHAAQTADQGAALAEEQGD